MISHHMPAGVGSGTTCSVAPSGRCRKKTTLVPPVGGAPPCTTPPAIVCIAPGRTAPGGSPRGGGGIAMQGSLRSSSFVETFGRVGSTTKLVSMFVAKCHRKGPSEGAGRKPERDTRRESMAIMGFRVDHKFC